ncbi:MAG: phytoene desaturase [Chloroflexi bacterium]|nr:phytoene desaturase [Chloroflexota bacterium]
MTKPKLIVIGAGPGGLSAAMRLATRGYDVHIYEAEQIPGGRMRGFSKDGYAFDTGPTILQVPRVYHELFNDCGLKLDDYVTFKRVDPNTRLKFWDKSILDLTSDLTAFKAQLAAWRSDLPEAFERWYTEHVRKNVVGYGPYLGTPVRSVLGYLKPDEIIKALSFRPWESLYDHFWNFFKDERIVYAMSYPSKYLGMHPTKCASVFSLVAWLEFNDGIWHPEGGFRALSRGLAKAASDLGVTIHYNTPVAQVLTSQNRVRGVLLENGREVAADIVLTNADFGYALNHILTPEQRGPYTVKKLNKMRFSCSTFMLYLGVNKRYPDAPHHQLYLSEHIRSKEPPHVDDSALDDTDPSFYVCNPTIIDPGNAPEGHSTLYVLVPIPNTSHKIDWAANQQRYRDLIVKRMAELGYDDVADHIVSETCFVAETWQDDYRTHMGAVFNLGHDWGQLGPFRPHIRADWLPGLYFVGGAVHPGSGLLTILESAKSSVHFIGEDYPVTQ